MATLIVAIITRDVAPFACLLVLAAIGLAMRGWHEIQLHDARLGIKLQRTTWAGFELSCRWIAQERLVPIRLEASQLTAYPLSVAVVATLPTELNAVGVRDAGRVLRAALIDLLVKDRVEFHLVQSQVFRQWQRAPSLETHYYVSTTGQLGQTDNLGALEGDILRALAGWPSNYHPKSEPPADRPSIYDLVMAMDDGFRSSYRDWLLGRVERDAAARGLGQLTRRFLWGKEFVWDARCADELQQDQDITETHSARLRWMFPDFSRELDKQIERGIQAREPNVD